MTESRSIELALLEGMDEHLLKRFHRAGITSRSELAKAMESREARAKLSKATGISRERIEAVHYLNFLLPEVRAGRFLSLEGNVQRDYQNLSRRFWGTRNALVVLGIVAGLSLLLALAALFRPIAPGVGGTASPADSVLRRLDALEQQVRVLGPLANLQIEAGLSTALRELGPAPGWYGPLTWDGELAAQAALLGDSPQELRLRALSLSLNRLAQVESRARTAGVLATARASGTSASEFPSPASVEELWDMAAVLLKLRLTARALGTAPLEKTVPEQFGLTPWSWTAPGFLQCEVLLTRLESLPVKADVLPLWMEALAEIRHGANVARDRLGERPEAWAREYWILRGELEFAVAAALLGRRTLAPYDSQTPESFIADRSTYLDRAVAAAPRSAKSPLAWLHLEYVETLALVDWLRRNPEAKADSNATCWVEALDRLRSLRPAPDAADRARLNARIIRCLGLSGIVAEDPMAHPRTRWESGLRPLLMATRTLGESPSGSSP